MLMIDPNLVPVVGVIGFVTAMAIGARAVMKPLIEAFLRARELKAGAGGNPARLDAQDRRINELEGELASMRQELDRLSAVESFYAQLQGSAPAAGRNLPPGAGASPV